MQQGNLTHDDLNAYDGLLGFIAIVMRKSEEGENTVFCPRLPSELTGLWRNCKRWRKYLVGEAPEKHWLYDGESFAKEKVAF